MSQTKHTDNRRKLLKSIAAGTGAVVAGKSLPESWSRPVVNSVLLPAHASTTDFGAGAPVNYSKTLGYDIPKSSENKALSETSAVVALGQIDDLIPDQEFVYSLGGVVPSGPGTVTISNLAGDLGDGDNEKWEIKLGTKSLGATNNSPDDCEAAQGSLFNISLADLQSAISSDSITVFAINGTGGEEGDIQSFCDVNTMDVTLAFPGLTT